MNSIIVSVKTRIILLCVLGLSLTYVQGKTCIPPISVKRVSKHISYPGVQGSPVVQTFYLWVKSIPDKRGIFNKKYYHVEFDSFYWAGYRGLGNYGINGSEIKSMRISTQVQEWRYWKDRFELDSAKENWILIVGTVEIPTRQEYDIPSEGFGTDSLGNLTFDGTTGNNGTASDSRHKGVYSDRLKRVPWTDADPELQVFYTIEQWTRCKRRQFKDPQNSYSINHFEPRKIQKVSQSVIRVDKIQRSTVVFHP